MNMFNSSTQKIIIQKRFHNKMVFPMESQVVLKQTLNSLPFTISHLRILRKQYRKKLSTLRCLATSALNKGVLM